MPAIVFIQTAFIGDLFLSLPVVLRLRIKFPDHKLILVCKKGLSEIFLKENYFDQAFEAEKGVSESYSKILSELKKIDIDYVFCPHRSFRSSLFAVQIKAKNKIGFKNAFNFLFFSRTVEYKKSWPDVIRQMMIVSTVDSDIKNKIQSSDWTYLNFTDRTEKFCEIPEIFSFKKQVDTTHKNTVAIFPGSVWQTKQWTISGFSEVTTELIKKNKTVLLMGGPSEKNICDEIAKNNPQAINCAGGLSLYESYLKLKTCDQVICNDSAPAHMAASLGIQVISIFGPTTLRLGFRPWQNESVVVENNNLTCRPCGAHGHHQCPEGHHRCMIDLKSESVLRKI